MSDDQALLGCLQAGGVAVVRTDTLYGLVARADDQAAVARVYRLKQRSSGKPLIVLLADPDQAYDGRAAIRDHSDGLVATSVIVASPTAPAWLRHPSDGTVAYRVPADRWLRTILRQTGPLVAPSANPQGEAPARDVAMARRYFGPAVDYYHDRGLVPLGQAASHIITVGLDGRPGGRVR